MNVMLMIVLAMLATAPREAVLADKYDEAMKHYRVGQQLFNTERWDSAEAEFKEAIKIYPLLDIAHYGLGQVYMATRRYREAVMAYQQCREAFRASEAESIADRTEAEQRLADRIRDIKDEISSLESGRLKAAGSGLMPGNTQQKIDQLKDMVRQLETRRHRNTVGPPPVPPWISIALGGAYYRTGAMADAEREYLEALKVDPKLGEGHNNLAVVYMLTGRYEEAQRAIAAAEKNGFKVHPQFKKDLQDKQKGKSEEGRR